MSVEPATQPVTESHEAVAQVVPRRRPSRTPLHAIGEPKLWLTGGALTMCVAMIAGLLLLIAIQGGRVFWPSPVVEVKTYDGHTYLGEIARTEDYQPTAQNIEELPSEVRDSARATLKESGGTAERMLIRTENFDLTRTHFTEVSLLDVKEQSRQEWALVVERLENPPVYGTPVAFLKREFQWLEVFLQNWPILGLPGALLQGDAPLEVWVPIAEGTEDVWKDYQAKIGEVQERWREWNRLAKDELGVISEKQNEARLDITRAELKYGTGSTQHEQAQERFEAVKTETDDASAAVKKRMDELKYKNGEFRLRVKTAESGNQDVPLASISRVYPPNRMSWVEKLGLYFSRWKDFVTDDPRQNNTAGGVFPAIWGTVTMTLLMCVVVVPFGVLAALYLREYAKFRPMITTIRIALNNLAGVPSIVFGVFGLGFFCYLVGGSIDEVFFQAEKANGIIRYGGPGMLWASLTMALLTLPVVIVTTEEALAAVPNSLREGSYGCGASKWQTIWRIVLPRALPGILTGAILAMARGAGEVAPLMLVGATNKAATLPVDSVFPYVHPYREFMHLGFQIYDVGFQSSNAQAAQQLVFTITLLLIAIVFALNLAAVLLRGYLRGRHAGAKML